MCALLRRSPSSASELWLALSLIPGVTRRALHRLHARYSDPERILERTPSELRAHVPPRVAARLGAGPDLERAREVGRRLDSLGARILAPGDLPPTLACIPDPPALLFVAGDLPRAPALAMVGARKATERGRRVATQLARAASAAGVPVVSGLAYGIDAAAHEGALAGLREAGDGSQGPGVAVWASGLDQPAPRAHARLARRLLDAGGAWVSEYPPGHTARPHQFPERNRLVSGLSAATLVVEAAPRSGSLWTARHALEQGREVWVVPGPVDLRVCAGSNALLRDGAAPVLEAEDILLAFDRPARRTFAGGDGERAPSGLGATAERIWSLLREGPQPLDALGEILDLEPSELARAVTELELHGCVSRVRGQLALR